MYRTLLLYVLKTIKIRAESPKDYSPGQRPGYLYIYEDGALKEQKMKPRMLVASSFSLAERHHTYSLLPKAVALDYGLLDFQPMLLNSLYTPSLSHSLQMNLWVIHGNSCSKRFYP